MIEQAFYDLSARRPAARQVTAFSHAGDARWAGIVELAPGDIFETHGHERTDVFVLHGALRSGTGEPVSTGGFLSLRCDSALNADHGAVLFVYREPGDGAADAIAVAADQRPWRAARVKAMRVADLVEGGYQLSLVEWGPGAHVARHDHPSGEEIFVLEGALESQGHTLAAGSWIRLHPGATHTPCARQAALILLRNGHL